MGHPSFCHLWWISFLLTTKSISQADFVRNGNAKQIMSLSKEHTTALWNAVQDSKFHNAQREDAPIVLTLAGVDDYASFSKINTQLLNAPTQLKHVPLRVYMPCSPPPGGDSGGGGGGGGGASAQGSFKVVQSLVAPRLPNRKSCSLLTDGPHPIPISPPFGLMARGPRFLQRSCPSSLPLLFIYESQTSFPAELSCPPPRYRIFQDRSAEYQNSVLFSSMTRISLPPPARHPGFSEAYPQSFTYPESPLFYLTSDVYIPLSPFSPAECNDQETHNNNQKNS